MADALAELLRLQPDGLQLTPGNQPTANFESCLAGVRTRTHHGYSPTQWKSQVWHADGTCAVASDSVHPPRASEPWQREAELPTLETMYPGYELGTGHALDEAMTHQRPLAVDVSHIFLQRQHGVLTEGTWARLQDYEHVAEVHVSRSDGRTDAHLPLTADTFGLEWALARLRTGTPVIFEAYLHRLPHDARRAQCALFERGRR